MTKPLKRPGPTVLKGRPAPKVKLLPGQATGHNHDEVYVMYRNLGPARSLRKLGEAVGMRWPANPVATGTLANWASKEGWSRRVAEYELGLKEGREQGGVPLPVVGRRGEEVDDVGVLEQAASQALASALRATSVAVRSPSDVKALVETANKALELADRLKQRREGKATALEIAEFGSKLLKDIDVARRKDFIFMAKTAAESACAEAGTTNLVAVLKKTAGSLGMRVNDDGVFYDLEESIEPVKPADVSIVLEGSPEEEMLEGEYVVLPPEEETREEEEIEVATDSSPIVEESEADLSSWIQQLRGDLPIT